ncbi:hypothetical protein J2T10_002632 [Paenarthrobacter nicotinovorans]|uniref:Apea-like HEPN domain-containing protein n=1 Tax=Paenarthrobacter nicotinovorans TaxID=29320 RepID=A0ABT9TNK8_PAENI|nr:hypothetical protein [Paenarthrobacter nicotinovorans]MDQ0102975.1 hypothetical protein [Paenarthrobacter nicotinovorans]
MPISFFDATHDFYREHQTFSTVSQSAAVGLFNLRRDVSVMYDDAGYFSTKAKPEHTTLRDRFLSGSGLTKADFLQLAAPDSFPNDLEVIVRMSLMTNISLFEGWQDAISTECDLSSGKKAALEWPSQAVYPRLNQNGQSRGPGCTDMLTSLCSMEPSRLMIDTFGPVLTAAPGFSRSNLDDFYICFRAWKEARNCFTHGGGRASSRFISDVQRLNGISERGLPPLSWFPTLPTPAEGETINIPFKDMLSFSQVLRMIVCTVDAELAQTRRGERVFFKRFTADRLRKNNDIPFEKSRRHRVISDICTRIRLPKPKALSDIDDALTARMGPFLRPVREN